MKHWVCAPSRRWASCNTYFPCRRLLLNLGVSIIIENFMSFTIATAVIFTAFATLLARDSDANQNWFGAWSNARDRRYTIGDRRCPLMVRVVLNATENGSGEGSQSAFNTTDKHLIFDELLTLIMHIARFPFPLPEGLCHNLHWGCISMALFHCQRSQACPFDHNCGA